MLLRFPASLHYPITVTELLKQPTDHVERFAPLFSYFYKTTVTEDNGWGTDVQVEKTFPTRFESSVEGKLLSWKIKKGDVISDIDVQIAEIEEPCAHNVQYGGMCADCGKDMSESTYNTEQLDSTRATINMVHDRVSLKISQDKAAKQDEDAKLRLLALKKLSLVVDLDQTIIHATVDPTVADWQKDVDNPNHNAVKDVRAFLLKDDGPKREGCWYYIKLRPNLEEFLEKVSQMYECHIYTMGTRAYAKEIAELVDPQHKIFGDRILSRDESGSMTAKNLQRLFPVDTKMVVIIDDRGDVWKWSPNLIKVTPYDFFVGIGDINSSFLPKKPGPRPSPKAVAMAAPKPNNDLAEGATKEEPEPKTNGNIDQSSDVTPIQEPETPITSNASPLEQLVAMGGSDDATIRQAQTNSKEEAVAEQLKERPLLQKQLQLEAEDAASEAAITKEEGEAENASPPADSSDLDKPKHNLLQDHDRELYTLEDSLRKVHTEFYRIHNKNKSSMRGGRLGEIHGGLKRKFSNEKSELDLVPDIKDVLPAVKARVLAGVVIVFSGLVPLGLDVGSTDIAILAKSFGARIEENVNRSTTHVVAARNRTLKVRKAFKRGKGRIKVVNPQWLTDSVNSWQKKDEASYLLDVEEGRAGHPDEDDDILSESESPADSSEGEETDSTASKKPSKPSLTIFPPSSEAGDTASDVDDDDVPPELDPTSPVGGDEGTWGDMNDEIQDFLDDIDDDSDGESVASGDSYASSKLSLRGKKRGREEGDSGGESDDSSAKKLRKKQALGNGLTSLSQTSNVDSEHSEEEKGVNGDVRVEDEERKEEGDGWDDFDDDEFEEELQKAGSEDQGDV